MVTISRVKGEAGHGVRLTAAATEALRADEALVFDWHVVALCCAAAGEVSLRRTTVKEVERSQQLVPLSAKTNPQPVWAHRRAYSHLVDQAIEIDCHRTLGMRRFTSDLPPDFGLRAVFGRLQATP